MLQRVSERSGHLAAIYDLRLATDGFYSAAADGYLVHWHQDDVDFGQVVAKVAGGKFLCMSVLDDGGLVAGALDGGLHWLYPGAEERNRHLAHHRLGIFSLLRLEDDLYATGGDGSLSRWSVEARSCRESLPLSPNSLRCIAHDPVRDRLAVGASDASIYLLDRKSMGLIERVSANVPSVFSLAFTPDGNRLISGGRDAQLMEWDVSGKAMKHLRTIPAHLATINKLAIDPTGQYLATASRDKTIKLWKADDLSLLKVAEVVRDRGHVNSVNTLLWKDDHTLLTSGDDRRVLEWKVG
jgi:WD40 repeat protein